MVRAVKGTGGGRSTSIRDGGADGELGGTTTDATGIAGTDSTGTTVANTLNLYHSTDHGKTWTHRDITPKTGRYEYAWLSVSPDGKKLGIGTYYRPTNTDDWYVYGSVFGTGSKPSFTLLDPVSVQNKMCISAPGDLMSSEFNPDGTLDVVWTRNTDPTTCGTVTVRDIYFARSN